MNTETTSRVLVRVALVAEENGTVHSVVTCGEGAAFGEVLIALTNCRDEIARQIEQRSKCPMSPKEPTTEFLERDHRQRSIHKWVIRTFGACDPETGSVPERTRRFFEEAAELMQACGGDAAMAHKIVDHVFSKPPGVPAQELGGTMTTAMALAESLGLSLCAEEVREFNRVLAKDVDHFRERHRRKMEEGI